MRAEPEGRAVMAASPREIAALVPMARLLAALGFVVSERTRRCPCVLHGGANSTAFSWRDDGRWFCHSCGKGGDNIELVRAVRGCSFREAVAFLAALAGVTYTPRNVSRREIEAAKQKRERAEAAAWNLRDEALRLLSYYRGALHRSERLMARFGKAPDVGTPGFWEHVERLAWPQTFFSAAYSFLSNVKPETLARFALASPAERLRYIFEREAHESQRECSA